ncbi:hypothetical protein GALMADRAFT_275797 [Galerina marginata CBS 339.88]|uniref:Zn(2)-C6 fungal-type domain-containing protein n=1 Tax=Galerina marginata (strain CBS 339.88) TaxID=685588 RepID=A0A067TRX0_GALM3|nr:hypothetical protein GALMADRAFT_275797 [Galerina marginata CBS 339.88]
MFSSNYRQQRLHLQSLPPSVADRQQDYHAASDSPARISLHPTEIPPRQLTGDHTGADLYPQTGGQFYTDGRHNSNAHLNDDRGSFSPISTFSQSYGRRTSSSDLHSSSILRYQGQNLYSDSSKLESPSLGPLRRNDIPDVLDNFSLAASHSTLPIEPTSVDAGRASEHSGDSDFWPISTPLISQPALPKPKKSRREKPHIELAPDQPPTTQGKPRARVYLACLQCRTRKIRCDGAKPVCHNCGRRANANTECNYDPIPKRRGPDKTPGARQRLARDLRNEIDNAPSRRRRRTRGDSNPDLSETNGQQPPLGKPILTDSPQNCRQSTSSSISLSLSSRSADNIPGNNTNFIPVSSYSRASHSPCGCHGLARCPGILGVGTLSSTRKPASIMNAHEKIAHILRPYPQNISPGYITELDEKGDERQGSNTPEIGGEPSLNFSRKIWWDSLLSLYISPTSTRIHAPTVPQRESAAQGITADLRFLFRASNYWFSFFHIPSFFGNFFDSTKRERIQPSLILALLAMSTFWQSSEIGYGKQGRERALRFRDEAQAAMDASFNAGWIDETLAQAAWLLALFEICAHPRHSSQRSTSSMVMLDSIIRSLSLTLVDADDPNATMFPPGSVPAVDPEKHRAAGFPNERGPYHLHVSPTHRTNESGCSCHIFTLGEHWSPTAEHAPLWGSTPAWNNSWTEGEIRKESCRRLCWSSMILAAGHISYTTAYRSEGLDLFIADPANYALLFSGESVARSPALANHSSKDTIWALHDRSFLLWHGCIRMRKSNIATDNDKAQFAVKAWLEADSLEQALNRHTCSIERAFIFQAREYIFNTRMCISYEFQRYVPLVTAYVLNVSGLFHRNKAEEWLTHQATVAERFMHGLHTITGNSNNLLARRPFFVFWFMGQIHRALSLWECDNTLTVALDVCKALIPAIDYLTALWPCAEQRYRYESLREKVASSCFDAGLEPPAQINLLLASPSSSEALV